MPAPPSTSCTTLARSWPGRSRRRGWRGRSSSKVARTRPAPRWRGPWATILDRRPRSVSSATSAAYARCTSAGRNERSRTSSPRGATCSRRCARRRRCCRGGRRQPARTRCSATSTRRSPVPPRSSSWRPPRARRRRSASPCGRSPRSASRSSASSACARRSTCWSAPKRASSTATRCAISARRSGTRAPCATPASRCASPSTRPSAAARPRWPSGRAASCSRRARAPAGRGCSAATRSRPRSSVSPSSPRTARATGRSPRRSSSPSRPSRPSWARRIASSGCGPAASSRAHSWRPRAPRRECGSARQGLDQLLARHRRAARHVLLLRALVELVAAELVQRAVAVAVLVAVAVEALARPRALERLLQRRHDVRRRAAGVAARLRRDDPPALALALDDLEQPLAVAVLVLRRIPVDAQRLHQRDRRVELRLGRLAAAAGVDVLGRADLVVEAHRRERQHAVADAHEHEVLLRAHHEPPERGAVRALHDLHQQLVRAQVALGLADGREEVRVVEVDGVDLVDVDERLDVDRARLARRGGGEVVVGEQDLLRIVEVIAAADRLERHLLVLLGAEPARVDRRAVLFVELAEVDVEVAHRAVERDRDVDEPEADRAGPQRAGHQRRPFFAPSRLALSVAMRSGAVSASGSSAATISSPLALRSITSSTAARYSSSYLSGLNFSCSVSMSCAAIFTSRSPGPRLGVAMSISPASTSSSAKRSVCRTRTPSRARTAVRYSRSWNVKRPIPARPVFSSASCSRRYGPPPSLPAPSQ